MNDLLMLMSILKLLHFDCFFLAIDNFFNGIAMSQNEKKTSLQILQETHQFPCDFMFKFIIPQDDINLLITHIGQIKYDLKSSSKGKYTSVTYTKNVESAEEILQEYDIVKKIIPKVVSL